MLELKTPKQLAEEAFKLAQSLNLVRYRSTTYVPVDYETMAPSPIVVPERTIWLPLSRTEIRQMAAQQFSTLFKTDGELSSFDFMLAQNATLEESVASDLLVRTKDQLMILTSEGELVNPSGTFVPNTMAPMLNEDAEAKARVLSVIREWLDSEEEAVSLLRHLATSLAPHWSAVKYVLLLGEGRNGKSVMLKMLQSLFGAHNVSNVTRQHISEQSPVVLELNGKLLNIVYDGRAEFVKDSGTEKSLIAGEQVSIRRLYESTPTPVQTNALFIEGLNREPKSSDKSAALQKRLVRFQFPNVYDLDHKFERSMMTEETLGAFLSLLIDHHVKEDEVAKMLAPTQKAIELQLDHMHANSLGLQFLKYIHENDTLGINGLLGAPMNDLVQKFQSWRLKENDLGAWSEPDVLAQFVPLIKSERRSVRINGQPRKVRVAVSLKMEARAFIDSLEGDSEDVEAAILAELVDG